MTEKVRGGELVVGDYIYEVEVAYAPPSSWGNMVVLDSVGRLAHVSVSPGTNPHQVWSAARVDERLTNPAFVFTVGSPRPNAITHNEHGEICP